MRTDRGLGIARVVIGVHSLTMQDTCKGYPGMSLCKCKENPCILRKTEVLRRIRNRAGRMPGTIHIGSHVQLTGIPPQSHATSRVF